MPTTPSSTPPSTLLASRRARVVVALVAGAAVFFAGGVAVSTTLSPRPTEVRYVLPPDAANPFLASGVAVGSTVATFSSAGTGPPFGANDLFEAPDPLSYVDYDEIAALYPDFTPTADAPLPEGVSVTEAQGYATMRRIADLLHDQGLTLEDIIFMRIYLEAPPCTIDPSCEGEGKAARADYAGWNDAYRKYMANVDLQTGMVIEDYEPVAVANPTRPARSNLEVATLPVPGWLVEIEVVAAYPSWRDRD